MVGGVLGRVEGLGRGGRNGVWEEEKEPIVVERVCVIQT